MLTLLEFCTNLSICVHFSFHYSVTLNRFIDHYKFYLELLVWQVQCFWQSVSSCLTHQASGLVWVCPKGGDRWGSRYIRSTGTSSAQPAGCLDWGSDPSEQTAMSQRMRCLPDLRLPSLESLEGAGRQIAWIYVWATASHRGETEGHIQGTQKNEEANMMAEMNASFLAL